MPGVGGFHTYTGDIARPTPDNVWQPLLLAPGYLALIRDKREALANTPAGVGTQSFLRPVVEVWKVTKVPFVLVHSVDLDASGTNRANYDLYYSVPLTAKGSENGGKPWLVVSWRIRKLSPPTTYMRSVTVSWPDGISNAPTRQILDIPIALQGVAPIDLQEMGTMALAQGLVAWTTQQYPLGDLGWLGYALLRNPPEGGEG